MKLPKLTPNAFTAFMVAVSIPVLALNMVGAISYMQQGALLPAAIHIACFVLLGAAMTHSLVTWWRIRKMPYVKPGDRIIVRVTIVKEGEEDFDLMIAEHDIQPGGDHSACEMQIARGAGPVVLGMMAATARGVLEETDRNEVIKACGCPKCRAERGESAEADEERKVH